LKGYDGSTVVAITPEFPRVYTRGPIEGSAVMRPLSRSDSFRAFTRAAPLKALPRGPRGRARLVSARLHARPH